MNVEALMFEQRKACGNMAAARLFPATEVPAYELGRLVRAVVYRTWDGRSSWAPPARGELECDEWGQVLAANPVLGDPGFDVETASWEARDAILSCMTHVQLNQVYKHHPLEKWRGHAGAILVQRGELS